MKIDKIGATLSQWGKSAEQFHRLNQNPVSLAPSKIFLGLGIASSLTLTLASAASAQIQVTGGTAVFTDTRIFVPDPGGANPLTEVFEGSTPSRILIRTTQGNIPLNAIFQSSILPAIDVRPGGIPAVGDTGNVLGTLTFRGFTAAGEPGLYTNIPTELDFQITSGNFSTARPYTKYQTEPLLLTETGTVSTPTTFTTVSRTTPVVAVQFQRGSNSPTSRIIEGRTIPASAFATDIPGNSFSSDFRVSLTGGSISIPNPPGFNANATVTQTPRETGERVNNDTPSTVFIPVFVTFGSIPTGITGNTQGVPVMPGTIVVGIFTFNSVPSGRWFDPPMAESFEFAMTPSPQPVGLTSRVFPGVTGTKISSDSVFTAISGFPEGVDRDDRFTVSVDGVLLGEFGPGDVLQFSDYRDKLGDRLVNGEGVAEFTIGAIDPGVNPADPRAFPIKLEFSTPTASFEMRARGEGLENTSMSSFRLSEEVEAKLREKFEAARGETPAALEPTNFAETEIEEVSLETGVPDVLAHSAEASEVLPGLE